MEEQVALLRLFWTRESITFQTEHHDVERVRIDPLPLQRPIPVWTGAKSKPGIARAARIADGFIPLASLGAGLEEAIRFFQGEAERADREPLQIPIEAWMTIHPGEPGRMREEYQGLIALGVGYVTLLSEEIEGNVERHLDAIRQARAAILAV